MIEDVLAIIVCFVLVFGGPVGFLIKLYLKRREECIERGKRRHCKIFYAERRV